MRRRGSAAGDSGRDGPASDLRPAFMADYSKAGKGDGASATQSRWLPSAKAAFLLLCCARLLSARLNVVADCDEVFNYWEPLHYLLYGYGLQTWEYSSKFALRSYLYLLAHIPVAGPAAIWLGTHAGKARVFFLTRGALGLCSSACEATVYRAALSHGGPYLAGYLLIFLLFSSGMFMATTAMLPSTFTMGGLMLAMAAVLQSKPKVVVWATAASAVVGWPFALVAALPYALYVLAAGRFVGAVVTGALTVGVAMGASAAADFFFYGRWTISQLNIMRYNAGGGDSVLYGVEPWHFYLRNGANNFNAMLPLALAAPALIAAAHCLAPASFPGGGVRLRLVAAILPLHVWLATVSSLPHKEERFLFVVYPHICLGAAAALAAAPALVSALLRAAGFPRGFSRAAIRLGIACIVVLACALSVSRSAAIITNYGAPMKTFAALPASNSTQTVCLAGEWHRFPSSFFLPGPLYRVGFVKSGFAGLMPLPFDNAIGGTMGAPAELNDRNQEVASQYVAGGEAACDFFVDLEIGGGPFRSGDTHWEVMAEEPFVDAPRSPPLYRALYIPGVSSKHVVYGRYVLLRRKE